MKKKTALFLKSLIIIFGALVLIFLIRVPLKEGRAVNLDLYQIYADPFILFGYVASVPFFVGLYKCYQLPDYIGQKETFSFKAINALKTIKYCALLFCVFIIAAAIFIVLFHNKEDDPAGFIALCILTTVLSCVVAFTASIFEKRLQNR
jgi:hypothetical protein